MRWWWWLWAAAATCLALRAAAGPMDQESFFLSLDKDKDGDLDENELKDFVKKELHEPDFDEDAEIAGGVDIALARIDNDNDRQIKHEDLVRQWVSLASIMTPKDISQWLEMSVGLPASVAVLFEKGGITGLKLPMLLDPVKGPKLLQQLGVKLEKQQKTKLWAAIKLRMLGVGTVPPAPPLIMAAASPRCGVVPLSWSPFATTFPEIHLYRLFRRKSNDPPQTDEEWTLVYSGRATAYSDRQVLLSTLFDYKLEAWNLIGVSPSSELHDVAPLRTGCGESSVVMLYRMIDQAVGTLYQVMVIAAFVAIVVFRHSTRPTIVAPHQPVVYAPPSSMVINSRRSSVDLQVDDLGSLLSSSLRREGSEPGTATSSSPTGDSAGGDIPKSHQCRKCQKVVTRSTRHICGSCQYAFCMSCTVYHPHLEVRSALGNIVVSPCGIESKCRCADCYTGPPLPPPMPRSESPPLPRRRVFQGMLPLGAKGNGKA